MCFIRKGLDSLYTQTELKWLDDIMPEMNRLEKDDKEREFKVVEVLKNLYILMNYTRFYSFELLYSYHFLLQNRFKKLWRSGLWG